MSKILIILLLLNGCVWNSRNYSTYVSKYVGMSETALYESWGYPNSQFEISPGVKEVTYVSNYTAPLGEEADAYVGSIYYPAINQERLVNPDIDTYYCKTSFTITDGYVSDYTFSGDDCVAN